MWSANEWHYYVIEKRLGPWSRALRRRWAALTGRIQTWREAWALRHGPREEERMADVETPTIAPAALGRVFFSKLDPETAQALRAAITEELLGLVKDEAVFEARQALEQEFTDRQERLQDDLEAQRRQIEKDAAAVADREAAEQLQRDEQDFQDRLDDLRGRLRDWRTRAETAEGLCLSLIRQLCGGVEQDPVYLRSISGEGVTELDRYAVNATLARAGLVLKSKATASARVVQTVLEPGKVHAHSLFWLTKAPVPGVVDPEDTEED